MYVDVFHSVNTHISEHMYAHDVGPAALEGLLEAFQALLRLGFPFFSF